MEDKRRETPRRDTKVVKERGEVQEISERAFRMTRMVSSWSVKEIGGGKVKSVQWM